MNALKMLTTAFGLIVALVIAGGASAGQTNVAVAANFTEPRRRSRPPSRRRPATRQS